MPVRTKDFLTPGDDPDGLIEVEVVDGLTMDDVSRADRQWEGPMSGLVALLTYAGIPSAQLPPSWSWEWRTILEDELTPTARIIGIEYEQKWQGLMALDLDPLPCYHQPNTPGIYLAYVGAAPWNLGYYQGLIGQPPKFDDVGEVFLSLATRKSMECGCNGCVVLHAASGSEGFYRKCGITELGPDRLHPLNLIRFEMTTERARDFLGIE